MAKRVTVLRYSPFYRIAYWVNHAIVLFLLITGLTRTGVLPTIIPEARTLHELACISWTFWLLASLYYFTVTGELKWLLPSPRRVRYAFGFLWSEIKAWFGLGPKPEEPIVYDAKREQYVEKIIGTEAIIFWLCSIVVLFFFMVGARFLLVPVLPEILKIFFVPLFNVVDPWVARSFGMATGYAFWRALHIFSYFLLGSMIILHIYMSIVYGTFTSLITGKRSEKVSQG